MKTTVVILMIIICPFIFSLIFKSCDELPTDHNSTDSITIDSVEKHNVGDCVNASQTTYGKKKGKRIKGIRNEIVY